MSKAKQVLFFVLLATGLWIGLSLITSNSEGSLDAAMCVTHHDTYALELLTIKNRNYAVLVADTPSKWQYGLMNIKSSKDICGHDGMIFKFPLAMPQTFWNKNTLVDLDIYWMRGEDVVGEELLPSISNAGLKTVSSLQPADRVVEIIR